MIIQVREDRMGNIIGKPKSKRIRNKIERYLWDLGKKYNYGEFFFQQGMGAEEFKNKYLKRRQRTDIEDGYTINIRLDDWEVGHFYSYDTHTLFE
jgi:hypothetical protein